MVQVHHSSTSDSAKTPASEQTSDSAAEAAPATPSRDRSGFWRVLISTFATIFLAELGDKTQLATLLMSAESGSPLTVFIGAGLALLLTSLVGVALGQWLARRVSPHTLDTAAGTVLLGITLWLLWDVVHF